MTFPCSWQGLDHCEVLAAEQPAVTDYYLFDGKERLQEVLRDLLNAIEGTARGADDLTSPGGASKTLEAVHTAINAHDPHYRYDFAVDAVGEGKLPPVVDQPDLVAAVTQVHDGRAVTFRVFARYREATSDRPVPGRFTLLAEPGTPEAHAVRDFIEYGIPVAKVNARELDIDLPGGLPGVLRGNGQARARPA